MGTLQAGIMIIQMASWSSGGRLMRSTLTKDSTISMKRMQRKQMSSARKKKTVATSLKLRKTCTRIDASTARESTHLWSNSTREQLYAQAAV